MELKEIKTKNIRDQRMFDEAVSRMEKATVKEISVAKTYNLGNYQTCRLEAVCGIPATDVKNHAELSDYYSQTLAAIDEAFRRNFQNTQK